MKIIYNNLSKSQKSKDSFYFIYFNYMTETKNPQAEYQNKYKVNIDDFKVLKEIQKGSHSSVYSVKNVKTDKKYAAKVIKNEEEGEMIKKMNNYSFNNIFLCQHPTLAKYYGYSPIDFNGKKNITLFIDLLSDTPLSSFIENAQNGVINIQYKKSKQIILLGIARGMMYLQEHHILHRDLNSSNIYLDDQAHPLIINYGFSNNWKNSKIDPKDLEYQDAIYIAPEILSSGHYNMKSNVYSFGIIMYEVLTDSCPYPLYHKGKMSSVQFVQKIINEDFHPKFSTPLKRSFKKLIKQCLSKNPHERPTFGEIFNMLAYNIEDTIFDTNDDTETDDNDYNYYIDDSNNDELFEYIDLITKNDIINYTDPLKSSISDLKRDNEILKKENEQMKESISLLKKQNVQLAKNFEKSYTEHVLPLEKNLEQVKDENEKLKKIISKYVHHRKESNLEISPPEAPKIPKIDLTPINQDGTSWDDFEDSKEQNSDKIIKNNIKKDSLKKDSLKKDNLKKDSLKKDDLKKEDKSFSDSEDDKRIRKRSNSFKERRYSKNVVLKKVSSRSDTEDFEVHAPNSARRPSRLLRKNDIKFYNSDEDETEDDFHETKINIDRFNALPLRFQRTFVSEFLKQTPDKFNQDLMLIKDLLNYLLLFHEKINAIHYFSISTNKPKDSYKSATEWCQDISEIHLLSAATQILFDNNSLDKSEFIDIIKQFKSVSIEVKYPSENFTKIFRIVSNIKESSISNLKIAVSLSGIATSDDTFRKNKNITSIKLDSTVLYIGKNSFRDCSSLAFISIPSSVQSIEYGAFRKCFALTQVTIPSSVTTIGEGAFSKCTALQKINIPDSITQIDDWAFSGCTALKEIVIPKSITAICVSCFADCTSLAKISIPSSVTIIERNAFHKCTALTNISLPSSLVSIGEGAFSKCTSLVEIEIPSKVTAIKKLTFAECSALEKVVVPSTVVTIEDQAFEGCFSLSEVPIPGSVTSLGFWAFPSNTVITAFGKK